MIEYHVFPDGKKRVVTFSYDDGHENDARLISLFNKYNVKGTFHINGSFQHQHSRDMRKQYKGHEIACHTVKHGWLTRMPQQSVAEEIFANRLYLENTVGYPVVGMSYPCGSYNEAVKNVMKMCGIVYSRTTKNTMGFQLPDDFMEWHPSCHHKHALELSEKFLRNIDSYWAGPLFYIWGHSSELETEADWMMMENILAKISQNEKIWYATNLEIYQYTTAQRFLVISADEKMFYNPSAVTVWVERNKEDIICVPAGQTVCID